MSETKELDNMEPKCPKCGAPVYKILYGEPMMNEDEYFKTYGEHVIFGGCCISDDSPSHQCSNCGKQFVFDE